MQEQPCLKLFLVFYHCWYIVFVVAVFLLAAAISVMMAWVVFFSQCFVVV